MRWARVAVCVLIGAGLLAVPRSIEPAAADGHVIDFGHVWGTPTPVLHSYIAARDMVVAPVSLTGPFELAQDLCSGATLSSGDRCILRIRPAENLAPGAHTGTLNITDTERKNSNGWRVEAHGVRGVLAFTGWPRDADKSKLRTVSQTSGNLVFGLKRGFGHIDAMIDGQSFRLYLSQSIDAPFEHGTYRTPWGLGSRGSMVSLSSGGLACDDGEFEVHEADADAEGNPTHLRLTFALDCGVSGALALDTEPAPDDVWVPSEVDFGTVRVATATRSAFLMNLGSTPAATRAATGLSGVAVTHDGCSSRRLAPWSACRIHLATQGSHHAQVLGGTVAVRVDAETSEVRVSGRQTVYRVVFYRGCAYYQSAAIVSRSTLDGDLVIGTDVFGSVSFTDERSTAAVVHMGNPRRGVGRYEFGTTGPGRFPLALRGGCADDGSVLDVHEANWTDAGEVTTLYATFALVCDVGSSTVGFASIDTALGFGVVEPSSLRFDYGVLDASANIRTLRLANSGDEAAYVALEFTVNDEFAFELVGSGCQDAILAPGESCEQEIRFSPLSRTGEPLWSILEIGGVHAFSGMEVLLTGEAPSHWPQSSAATGHPESGYWLLHADGSITGFGDARNAGGGAPGDGRAIKVAPTPSGRGYWILGDLGQVWTGGDARNFGQLTAADLAGHEVGERAVSLSPTPSGLGYWIFTNRGRVHRFGDAGDIGDLLGLQLAGPIIDSIATPSGRGVFMIGTDGGVFALGDAAFAGSVPQVLPGTRLDQPIVGIVADPDGAGYWLVAADGGVFAFDAGFRGSVPAVLPAGVRLDQPVNGMVPYGDGYLLVASDGGVFNFSSVPFEGSLGGVALASPVVAIAPIP